MLNPADLSERLSHAQLKNRLLGAGLLVMIAVTVIPFLLGNPKYVTEQPPTPGEPESTVFESKIQPLSGTGNAPDTVQEAAQNNVAESSGLVLKQLDSAEGTQQAVSEVDIQPLRLDKLSPQPAHTSRPGTAQTPKETTPASKKAIKKNAKSTVPDAVEITSGWAVQVGLFSKTANAESIVKDLKNIGYAPKISDAKASFGKAKRVWIGPFSSKSEARKISSRLEKKTGNGGFVKPYPFN